MISVPFFESLDIMATSGSRERALRRDRRHRLSTTSMDDWYLDVCKRNVNKLSVVDAQQTSDFRPRSGSFKYTVTFVTGKWNASAVFSA